MTTVEIHGELWQRRSIAKLGETRDALAAVALWTLALSWMQHEPIKTSIPPEAVTALGGSQRLADMLVQVGLWTVTADGSYEAPRTDLYGQPLWRPEPVMPGRPQIPRQIRAAVFTRDGHRCMECGTTDDLTLDHIYPWSLGGPDTEDNLRVLCRICNSRKGARV